MSSRFDSALSSWLALIAAGIVSALCSCDMGSRTPSPPVRVDSVKDFRRLYERVEYCRARDLRSECRGLIYVWSSAMPLSRLGIEHIKDAARDLRIPVTILRSSVISDLLSGSARSDVKGSGHSIVRDMVGSGATVHYPSVILYTSEGIQRNAILGYKTAGGYRQSLKTYAADRPRNRSLSSGTTASRVSSAIKSAQENGGFVSTEIPLIGGAGAYFRWVPGTNYVAYERAGEIQLLNIVSRRTVPAPGYVDFIPTPDGRLFVTPGRSRGGLEFYEATQIVKEGARRPDADVRPIHIDERMVDQYPSVGILGNPWDAGVVRYRVVTSWYDNAMFRDYEARRVGGKLAVRPVSEPVPVCGNLTISLPMIAQDGRELAARDEATASTKIFRVMDDGTCEVVLDLKLQTGKVAWQAGSRRIAFAIPRGAVEDGRNVLWRMEDADDELSGVFVYDRHRMLLTRLVGSELVDRLTFPEFVGRDTVMFLVTSGPQSGRSHFRMVWPVNLGETPGG